MFGEVLAREYSEEAFFRNHRLTVDAYALQHPGQTSPQSIQSVAVHLSSLFLVFENGSEFAEATNLIKRMTKHKEAFFWLEPPIDLGSVSVRDVWASEGADAHLEAVKKWAASTWAAWRQHHTQVQLWVKPFI